MVLPANMDLRVNHFTRRVTGWLLSRFGHDITFDRKERAARLVEESIELAQAEGVDWIQVHKILFRVFARPPGEPTQEAGGIGVCLLAWANAAKVDITELIEHEVLRIESVPVEVTRDKHAAKVMAGTGLPLGEPVVVGEKT